MIIIVWASAGFVQIYVSAITLCAVLCNKLISPINAFLFNLFVFASSILALYLGIQMQKQRRSVQMRFFFSVSHLFIIFFVLSVTQKTLLLLHS
jgi:heme O synthase-like polyprenyltransferase